MNKHSFIIYNTYFFFGSFFIIDNLNIYLNTLSFLFNYCNIKNEKIFYLFIYIFLNIDCKMKCYIFFIFYKYLQINI